MSLASFVIGLNGLALATLVVTVLTQAGKAPAQGSLTPAKKPLSR